MKKYIVYEQRNNSGFGNQLRSIAGWYLVSIVLDRQFIIKSDLFNYAFISSSGDSEFDYSDMSYRWISPLEKSTDLVNFTEDVLLVDRGQPMIADVRGHPQLGPLTAKYINKHNLSNDNGGLAKYIFKELIQDTSPRFKNIVDSRGNVECIDYSKDEFPRKCNISIDYKTPCHYVIQFRTGWDNMYGFMYHIDTFIENFTLFIRDIQADDDQVFCIMSDSNGIAHYLCYRFQRKFPHLTFLINALPQCKTCCNRGAQHSSQPGKSGEEYYLSSISDWLLMSKSLGVYYNGQSFVESMHHVTGTPVYSYKHYTT